MKLAVNLQEVNTKCTQNSDRKTITLEKTSELYTYENDIKMSSSWGILSYGVCQSYLKNKTVGMHVLANSSIREFVLELTCFCPETRGIFQKRQYSEKVLGSSSGKSSFVCLEIKHNRATATGTLLVKKDPPKSNVISIDPSILTKFPRYTDLDISSYLQVRDSTMSLHIRRTKIHVALINTKNVLLRTTPAE